MKTLLRATTLLAGLSAFLTPALVSAEEIRSKPTMVPIVPGVPDATDTPYPGGPITLDVDASDNVRNVFHVTETVPVAAGATSLILQYPEWIPGDHAASGPIDELNDIHFLVDGKPVKWWRDPVEVYAFHIELPAGAKAVTATFVNTSPLRESEGEVMVTPEMTNLEWNKVSLYPAGHYVRDIRIKPTVKFPAGYGVGSALDGKQVSGDTVSWAETDYETLVDSPVFAGIHFKRWDLGHDVAIDVVADKAEDLEVKPEHLDAYKALVAEAFTNYGAHHFDHYDILLALSDKLGGVGLEHHRSSENSMDPKAWTEWKDLDWDRNVVAHEFSHSWCGKFRRPAKLWTPDYRTPMQDNLLWVYEGQNQFWGLVLAARSGVQSKDIVLGELANYAGGYTQLPGREWRSVEDTTFDEIMNHRGPKPFASIARREDYYTEGALIWLEADGIIREGTGGKKSMDDFAKVFFGMRNGDWGELPYSFDDVAAALNQVYPHDWAAFLNARINTPNQPAPLAGIEKGGYRLVWKDEPNPRDKAAMTKMKMLSLYASIGVTLDKDGKVTGTRWDSPAFNAGLITGTKIIAVNGETYDADGIKDAIKAAKGTDKSIDLIIQRGDKVMPVSIAYHDGLRYPWLVKATDTKAPTGLDLLLAPKRPGAK
jgi:predicted metalloprotease with PDZ domain